MKKFEECSPFVSDSKSADLQVLDYGESKLDYKISHTLSSENEYLGGNYKNLKYCAPEFWRNVKWSKLPPIPSGLYYTQSSNYPTISITNLWHQQNGLLPHYTVDVRRYFDQVFPNRWNGRRGSIQWPLGSITFFLWDHLRNVVYKTTPENIVKLKTSIRKNVIIFLKKL